MAKVKKKGVDILKQNTIKRYIKDVLKMKISARAAGDLRARYDELIKKTAKASKVLAKKERRSTIMPRDMTRAIEDTVGKKRLAWREILEEIKHLNAINLGNLVKALNDYIQEEKERKE